MILKRLAISALIFSASHLVVGESLTAEQNKLDRYYQSYENRASELEEIENEIFGYENKLDESVKDLEQAQAELVEAQKAHANAKIQLAGDASQDNERALKLADHALSMAERGVRTRSKRQERVELKMAELVSTKTKLAASTAADQERITAQEAKVARASAEAEKNAAARLAEADRAREQAQLRMAEQARQTKGLASAPIVSAPKNVAPAPKVTEAPAVALQSKDAVKTELTELDLEALAYAQKEVARLETLLDTSNPGRPMFKRLTLGGNKVDQKAFEFLGQNQYRVDAVVQPGRQIFQVGKHKFRRTVPLVDEGQEYVFIFDAKRPSRPRLVMFKKSLIDSI